MMSRRQMHSFDNAVTAVRGRKADPVAVVHHEGSWYLRFRAEGQFARATGNVDSDVLTAFEEMGWVIL